MSEQILKALMQLFAIIARPESNRTDRRTVVESYLSRQLNQELVEEYLKVFDEFYEIHQHRQAEIEKRKKRTASSSVRVLLICTEINEELTQKQKTVVLVQLLEFVKSDTIHSEDITEQEFAFIATVSDTFNIPRTEYSNIKDFVLFPPDKLPESNDVAIINSSKEFIHGQTRHLYSESIEGHIRILNVSSAGIYLLRYLGESEMYLNGQLLQHDKVFIFNTGSSIRNPQIRPIYYSDIVGLFNLDLSKTKIIFEVKDISYTFRGGKTGLHNMSFIEESGKLMGIMGASGAGKSTLLNVLNGSEKPTTGKVLINGIDIHKQREKIEGIIGFVSQDDLLIEELSVFDNLYYNAKLCFDNYTEAQLIEAVETTLLNLGLYEIKDLQVGNPLNKKVSGGQRKRLNIALELIREPAVLFLDEPTSGLSSRDSENIMDLLKELSLKGKLVFVVIHQPSSDIFKMLDRLLILDTGGYLIYNGDPIDSIIYFKSKVHHANWNESECHICGNVNPEQIFNIVEANVLDEYGKLTYTRKISPREWNDFYNHFSSDNGKEYPSVKELPAISFKIPNRLKQFLVFVKRDVLSKLSNTQYLIINLFEAPLLAGLLSFIIKYYNVNVTNHIGYIFNENDNLPVYLFMSVIVSIFMGLTVSAEEIIKDRKILKREAFLNLSWGSYLFSKAAVLLFISAIQALSFVIVGNSIIEIKEMYWQYWLVLFSSWISANLLGLVISDSFKTVVTIYILIPFLVIPQIILSGIIVKYEKLNPTISSPGSIPIYGEIITARWAYEALAVYQFKENKYEQVFYPYDKAMSIAEFKKNYWLKNLKNKIDDIERYYQEGSLKTNGNGSLRLLRNELGKEVIENTAISFQYINRLNRKSIDKDVIDKTKLYIDLLSKYYMKLYNKANMKKDSLISAMQNTEANKSAFLKLKRNYCNSALSDFVTNSGELDRIAEYKNHLYQKIDPIYLDPEPKFIKAHFYAPVKQFFGEYYSTFWVNIIVLWITTIILFLLLYFRILKKILDLFDQVGYKNKSNS
jgi:ABC transport system ATP-binding/permease protein